MAVPAGFKLASKPQQEGIPSGFKLISQSGQSVGQTLIGAADIAGQALVGAGKEVVEGLSGLGGVIAGRPVSESVEAARALTAQIPDVQLGEQGQALIQSISQKFQASPQLVKDIFNAAITLGPSIGESAFQATEGLPAPVRAGAAALVGAIPGAIEGVTGLRAPRAIASATQAAAAPVEAAVETATDLFTTQSPTKQRIARLIEEGSTDVETARFKLEEPTPRQQTAAQLQASQGDLPPTPPEVPPGAPPQVTPEAPTVEVPTRRPRVIKDKPAVEAIKQGFDEGVVAAVKNAGVEDKQLMRQMVNIMERSKKDARFAATNRPSDVLGESVIKRLNIVRRANKAAGQRLDDVAKSLKGKQVDLTGASDQFITDLDDIGITLVAKDGDLVPNFSGSDIEGLAGPESAIKRIVKRMTSGKAPDAHDAHRLKRFIDEQVTFGKNAEGLAGKTESILKSLRRNIDQTLDNDFPEYDRINSAYSETIGALDAFQDVAGKKMNLTGPNAAKATGTLMRRVLSNAQSRITLLDSVNEIESVAKKFENFRGKLDPRRIEGPKKTTINDDLINQVLFVDELDAQFGTTARTSLQGQIQQGVEQAAQATVSPLSAAVRAGATLAEKARGINNENAFKSIKELLKEGGK